jgi:hypothetical protein
LATAITPKKHDRRARGGIMIKVMWLVKRADHLSLEEFERWWTETHAPDIRDEQVPHLVRYIVNVRMEDNLVSKPAEECEWDGIAEEWFPTEAAFNAVYGKENRDAHEDSVSNTGRIQRLVVREVTYV